MLRKLTAAFAVLAFVAVMGAPKLHSEEKKYSEAQIRQQNKMRDCAQSWHGYKDRTGASGMLAYRSYMSDCLKGNPISETPKTTKKAAAKETADEKAEKKKKAADERAAKKKEADEKKAIAKKQDDNEASSKKEKADEAKKKKKEEADARKKEKDEAKKKKKEDDEEKKAKKKAA